MGDKVDSTSDLQGQPQAQTTDEPFDTIGFLEKQHERVLAIQVDFASLMVIKKFSKIKKNLGSF